MFKTLACIALLEFSYILAAPRCAASGAKNWCQRADGKGATVCQFTSSPNPCSSNSFGATIACSVSDPNCGPNIDLGQTPAKISAKALSNLNHEREVGSGDQMVYSDYSFFFDNQFGTGVDDAGQPYHCDLVDASGGACSSTVTSPSIGSSSYRGQVTMKTDTAYNSQFCLRCQFATTLVLTSSPFNVETKTCSGANVCSTSNVVVQLHAAQNYA